MTCGECANYCRPTELIDSRGAKSAMCSAYITTVFADREVKCGKSEPRREEAEI